MRSRLAGVVVMGRVGTPRDRRIGAATVRPFRLSGRVLGARLGPCGRGRSRHQAHKIGMRGRQFGQPSKKRWPPMSAATPSSSPTASPLSTASSSRTRANRRPSSTSAAGARSADARSRSRSVRRHAYGRFGTVAPWTIISWARPSRQCREQKCCCCVYQSWAASSGGASGPRPAMSSSSSPGLNRPVGDGTRWFTWSACRWTSTLA